MRIGPIDVALPLSQAGLAGYSDRAMRLVARRRGCPYAVTEALLDLLMLNGGEGLRRALDQSEDDHPLAGQLIGSEPDEMARAAMLLWQGGFDVIDLNFACPVKKIKNKARGGHMLTDVPRALAILRAVRDALPQAPLTVKLRRGFDDSAAAREAFDAILAAAWEHGCAAATVHARTVEQKYVGASRWPFLAELKRQYPDKTVLGSGDIFTAEAVVAMLRQTGVDGVSIARGAIGNPWIFDQARALLQAGWQPGAPSPLVPPSVHEQREALREHFALAMQVHGEELAGRRMRKQGIKYSRFHPQGPSVKSDFIAVQSLRTWNVVLDRWYAQDAPGVWPDPRAADEVNDCE